jgi:hypothetical protein
MDVAQPRLSRPEFTNYLNQELTPLCSRDINPPGAPSPQPLISPGEGEVIILDTVLDESSNEGLGQFIVIALDVGRLPMEIRQILQNQHPTIASLIQQGRGFLFIGYAHLSQIAPGLAAGVNVNPGTLLGYSGNSGTSLPIHLDITVYYISGLAPRYDPRPRQPTDAQNFRTFHTTYLNPQFYGTAELIDPLTLWPILYTTFGGQPPATVCS